MQKLVVTRHIGLFQYLVKHGYVDKDTQCVSRVEVEDVIGKHVFGVLVN